MTRKYTHPLFNSSHWKWYWDIYFHQERLDNTLVGLYEAMKKDLYETEYLNIKYDQYKK